jgi:uncharacterized protein GlcG (DUF336 family)
MALSVAKANQAIEAALARARELSLNVSVSICDSRGHLIAHQRMDGALDDASHGSIGKAIAAALSGRPSEEHLKGIPDRPPIATVWAAGAPILHKRGGLPIIRQGEVEGALGVSGAPTNEQDEECARAGIRELQHEH